MESYDAPALVSLRPAVTHALPFPRHSPGSGFASPAGVLGFRLHQSYESRETGYLSALVGFGPELQCTLLELRQQWQPAASSGTAAPAVHAGGNAEEDAAAVLVDLPSPRARRAAPAAPSAQQLVRFMVEKPDLQAAADGLKVRPWDVRFAVCWLRLG